MYAVIFKEASLGHQFDADDYRDVKVSIFRTLREAVEASEEWNGLCTRFGHNHSLVYEVGKERTSTLIRAIATERNLQKMKNHLGV